MTNEKSNQHSRGRLEGAPGCDGEKKVRESERQRKRSREEKKTQQMLAPNTHTHTNTHSLVVPTEYYRVQLVSVKLK